jgi:choline/glycine/proline betaine transport protein
MLGMCIATIRSFHLERQAHLAAQRRKQRERLVDEAVAAIEEGRENGTLSGGPGDPDAVLGKR